MDSVHTKKVVLSIGGMTCANCKSKIERTLLKTEGVKSARVSLEKNSAEIEFDEEKIPLESIVAIIEELGYTASQAGDGRAVFRAIFYAAVIAVLFIVLQKTGVMNALVPGSLASSRMSYALLFVTGLFTSVHCIAMCGGINLSQSLPCKNTQDAGGKKRKSARSYFLPGALYNLGRVVSYTLIGLVLGIIGFFIGGRSASAGNFSGGEISIPLSVQGLLKIIAGIIMLLMGLSLLGIFPFLRNLTPRLPSSISKRIYSAQARNASPFIVGILNGFMPCGPLQAMWVVALASANPLSGALSMLAFSLGTVPLMLGLGSLVSLLGKKYSQVVMKIGAVIVVVMALSMLSQGLSLSGGTSSAPGEEKTFASESNVQIVKSKLNPYRYPSITVKKGVPVHWEIEASKDSLTSCNYKVIFRDFGFMYQLGYGTNVIEFTPEKSGTFHYTCWMGMVRGTITVKD